MIATPVGRIIEISNDRRHLSLSRGFMIITDSETRTEAARIPIDDIAAVIAHAHGLSYTNNLLIALAERCVPLVLSSDKHNAIGMLIPIEGNYEQARRFDAQIAASVPTRKRLWASVVRAKISQQGALLRRENRPHVPLTALIAKVRSGDPDNIEAQAARRYWTLLFGSAFRRDRDAPDINTLLNFGYSILRSAMARAVVAAGLHPTLGIHHRNQGNSMRLVDDLMEPFRPIIDARVLELSDGGLTSLTPEAKRYLGGTMYLDQATADGRTPLIACLNRLAISLVQVYLGERKELDLPKVEAITRARRAMSPSQHDDEA